MKRIKKGDQVIVIAGKDKGRQGTVLKVADDSILIEAVNMVKKHTKANPMAGVEGGIVEKEMPMDISNVMLFNPMTNKGDRVGFKMLEDGRKVRYFKSNGEVVDV
ncbi:MAG: 50S ribosomal protein L24 [Gammaproteobacteria bacterium]|nr:50S ribosomal protein L24 [Gammaproteobacteria bacterium]MBT8134322.1 50S ribosomal protein L24 [Gammaproteobacteria bacterium]NNJ50409.1 50S ribosomal protein L24 [Gammaproteobacteria bacterium]